MTSTLIKLSLIPFGVAIILGYNALFLTTEGFPIMMFIWAFGAFMIGGFMLSVASGDD